MEFQNYSNEYELFPTMVHSALDLAGFEQRTRSPTNLPYFDKEGLENRRSPSISSSVDNELCLLCADTTDTVFNMRKDVGIIKINPKEIIKRSNSIEDITQTLSKKNLGALKYLINVYNSITQDKSEQLIEFWINYSEDINTLNFIKKMIDLDWLYYNYKEYHYYDEDAFQLNNYIKTGILNGLNFYECIDKYNKSNKATLCLNIKNTGGCDYPCCIFYHPKCRYNNYCTIKGCNFRHPDKREKNKKNNPLCKYNQKCTKINCPFQHNFICKYGMKCLYLKKGICKGIHS